MARWKGQPVASIISLRAGSYAKSWRIVFLKEVATPLRATELPLRLAVEEACRGGYRFLRHGGTSPGSPIAAFKEKFGATPHFTRELRAERLPAYTVRRGTQVLA
jgi:hypothetical protein